MSPLLEGVPRAAAKPGVTPVPPTTLVGVVVLDIFGHLVEIEAAAVPDRASTLSAVAAGYGTQFPKLRARVRFSSPAP